MGLPRMMRLAVLIAVGVCGVGGSQTACGQRALIGQPFGVANLTVPISNSDAVGELHAAGFEIFDEERRVFYPVLTTGTAGELAADILGDGLPNLPRLLRVSFLFTGNDPLRVTVFTPQPQEIIVTPTTPRRGREYDRALSQWWRMYNAFARQQQAASDYPPLVHAYLTSMLSQRLGLKTPLLTRRQETEASELQQTIGLLFGTEELRTSVLLETMRGLGQREEATFPVPGEVIWQPLALPEKTAQVSVEEIARHVPDECFYVRFGSFQNYLWFDHLKDDYGGDLSRMITQRGHQARLDEKVQRQLALEQTALSEAMGPSVISDVALIGNDLYLREGPSLGVLFEAKNSSAVHTHLSATRDAALQRERAHGARLEHVTIADHEVSFLSTPDSRLRSFHAVDGDYHLVTTSRALVERFYAAGRGEGSLGQSPEFHHARSQMPLTREDTIFAYFSSSFFRRLVSPHYQVELYRRIRSVTDMELIQLAQLAAVAEEREHQSTEDLIAGGFLPEAFGSRDRTMVRMTDYGFVDPLRGARGTFVPIPDMPLEGVTGTEQTLFNRSARYLEANWTQMDPLMIGVKRFTLDGERLERVVIDGNVSPFAEDKYGWVLSLLGPPAETEVVSDPDDVIMLQMSLRGGILWPDIPPHRVFLGVQDVDPGVELVPDGLLQTLWILQSTPGYLGAWPKLGLLDIIPLLSPEPDVLGFSPLPLGLWRWQGGGFSVLSFQRGVLEEAATHLQTVPASSPAQIRIRVGHLANSRLAGFISLLNFGHALQISQGNMGLLQTLTQQFRVSPPHALELANQLLDTTLVCALGGEYEYHEDERGHGGWRSTAWLEQHNQPPHGHQAPLLEWFRGASMTLTKLGDEMILHAEIDLERKKHEPAFLFPGLPLFQNNASDSRNEQ